MLFDQGTPVPLRNALPGHEVSTAYELGWSTLKNGELLRMAEERGFEVLVTTDTNLRYQQDLTHRRIAIVVLDHKLAENSWRGRACCCGSGCRFGRNLRRDHDSVI